MLRQNSLGSMNSLSLSFDSNNFEDNKLINEIKEFTLDEDLKEDLNNILLQSKVVFNNAINQDQYQDLVDDCKK